MKNAYEKAVAAERRRCTRLGIDWRAPAGSWRKKQYSPRELFEIGNQDGAIATYWVGPRGRVTRQHDGGIPAS